MTAPAMWVAAVGGLLVEVVRELLPDLRSRASAAAVDEAARRIAGAVRKAPISMLPPSMQASAHTELAEMLVATVTDIGGLSAGTREKLRTVVGRKLLRSSIKKLDQAADEAIKAADRNLERLK